MLPDVPSTEQREFHFAVRTNAEQAEIVRLLEETLKVAGALEAEIDALRKSILKKAFFGQLVPQGPEGESASALLERIKAEKAKKWKTSHA